MSITDMDSYEGQISQLDHSHVLETGEAVDRRLYPDGQAISVVYQPGNGTRYDLVFVPVGGINHLWERLPAGTRDPAFERRWTLVVKCNGSDSDFAYPFDLSRGERAHVGYVQSHTRLVFADACAVTALLRAIAGVEP